MKTLSSEVIKEIQCLAAEYKESSERLMEILLKIQEIAGNSFSKETMEIVSNATAIPESKLHDHISFYAMFSTENRGKYIIRMCKSAPCHVCGAREVARAICDFLGVLPGETTENGLFTVEFCECIGLCESSPSVMINDKPYSNLTPSKIREILTEYAQLEEGVTV